MCIFRFAVMFCYAMEAHLCICCFFFSFYFGLGGVYTLCRCACEHCEERFGSGAKSETVRERDIERGGGEGEE